MAPPDDPFPPDPEPEPRPGPPEPDPPTPATPAQVLVFLEQLRAPLAATDPARAAFDLVIARVTSSATTSSP
jgi:hypothetical protein